MKKWSLLIVIPAFLLFLFYYQSQQHETNPLPDRFHTVQSVQAITQSYSKDLWQLDRAAEKGFISPIQMTKKMSDIHRTLQIEKAWIMSQQGHIYLLYSLDIHKFDTGPAAVPKLNVSTLTLNTSKGEDYTSQVTTQTLSPAFALQQRLYRGMIIKPKEHYQLKHIQSITLGQPVIQSSQSQIKHHLNAITLPISYHFNKALLAYAPIQKSVRLSNKALLTYIDLEVHMNSYKLNYKLKRRGQLKRMKMTLLYPPYHFTINPRQINQAEGYVSFLRRDGMIPHQLRVDIYQSIFKSSQPLSKTLTKQQVLSHLEQKEQQAGIPIGDIFSTHFSIRHMTLQQQTWTVQIHWEKRPNQTRKRLITPLTSQYNHPFNKITMTNNQQENPEHVYRSTVHKTKQGYQQTLRVNRDFLKQSKSITFSINHLYYSVLNRHDPVTIHIK